MLTFHDENYDTCAEGIKALVNEAWEVNGHGTFAKEIPEPDFEAYNNLNFAGLLGCIVMRDGDRIVGYSTFYLTRLMHHSKRLGALSDSIFVHPAWHSVLAVRELIYQTELAAMKRKASKITWMALSRNAFGALLSHLKYEPEATLFVKPL